MFCFFGCPGKAIFYFFYLPTSLSHTRARAGACPCAARARTGFLSAPSGGLPVHPGSSRLGPRRTDTQQNRTTRSTFRQQAEPPLPPAHRFAERISNGTRVACCLILVSPPPPHRKTTPPPLRPASVDAAHAPLPAGSATRGALGRLGAPAGAVSHDREDPAPM